VGQQGVRVVPLVEVGIRVPGRQAGRSYILCGYSVYRVRVHVVTIRTCHQCASWIVGMRPPSSGSRMPMVIAASAT